MMHALHRTHSTRYVIPAKAGTSVSFAPSPTEVPAFAGMTLWTTSEGRT